MDTRSLVAVIDIEISRLQQVKALLSGKVHSQAGKLPASMKALKTTKRRKLSAAARANIAAAQRERWARFRKTAK